MSSLQTAPWVRPHRTDAPRPPRVLVVEDDPGLATVLRMAGEQRGFRVDIATDGEEGLLLARQCAPDLILLDLMLPVVDGFTVLQTLRRSETTTRVPIMILSARATDGEREHGLALGADEYMFKPYTVREVMSRADALLARGR